MMIIIIIMIMIMHMALSKGAYFSVFASVSLEDKK
jgi:hypothetical protein